MTSPKGAIKPDKPRPDFPLTPHPGGQWCKKIHGKLRFFGPWADPEGALEEYHRQRDAIEGGGTAAIEDRLSVRLLCHLFEESKQQLVDQGDRSPKTLAGYKAAGERLQAFFGPSRRVTSLTAADFQKLRKSFPEAWGAVRINNEIIRIKAVFNYAYKDGLIDKPIRTGSVFQRVSAERVRIERAGKEAKYFEAAEIHALLSHASPQMRAMIMLGVNCGYGNADVGRLTRGALDLKSGWLIGNRQKTGLFRAAWLWPETRESLREVLAIERKRVPDEYADLVFLTRYRKPWWVEGDSGDPISKEFTKLRTAVGVFRRRVGFYALRHVTQTVGEQTPGARDGHAIRILMGHVDGSISAQYRESYDRAPIKAICEHLRRWWLLGKSKKRAQKTGG